MPRNCGYRAFFVSKHLFNDFDLADKGQFLCFAQQGKDDTEQGEAQGYRINQSGYQPHDKADNGNTAQ